jgi:hypothetical protein
MELVTWSEAKASGLKHYFTGKPCKRGHIALRQTSALRCMECAKEKQAERMKDPEKRAKQIKIVTEYNKKRRATDSNFRMRDNEYRKKWTHKKMQDPEYAAKVIKQNRIASAKRRAINPSANRFKAANYKISKYKRIPGWLTKEDRTKMKSVYAMRDWLNWTVPNGNYQVDHVIPLRGVSVSGFHVPENLQIIRGADNARKGNYYEAG